MLQHETRVESNAPFTCSKRPCRLWVYLIFPRKNLCRWRKPELFFYLEDLHLQIDGISLPSGLVLMPRTLLRLTLWKSRSFKIIQISHYEAESMGVAVSHERQVSRFSVFYYLILSGLPSPVPSLLCHPTPHPGFCREHVVRHQTLSGKILKIQTHCSPPLIPASFFLMLNQLPQSLQYHSSFQELQNSCSRLSQAILTTMISSTSIIPPQIHIFPSFQHILPIMWLIIIYGCIRPVHPLCLPFALFLPRFNYFSKPPSTLSTIPTVGVFHNSPSLSNVIFILLRRYPFCGPDPPQASMLKTEQNLHLSSRLKCLLLSSIYFFILPDHPFPCLLFNFHFNFWSSDENYNSVD